MIQKDIYEVQDREDSFYRIAKFLGVFRFLRYCGFRKVRGVPMPFVIYSLLTQVFAYGNLFRRMTSRWGKAQINCGKDVFYDVLSNPTFDWAALCVKVALCFTKNLNRNPSHRSCLIVDDTMLHRPRAKNVELCSRLFDHVIQKTVKGFNLLTVSWNDGLSTIPVAFALMASSKKENRIKEANSKIDKRTHGAKRRKEAVSDKNSMVVELVKRALKAGIPADYILMDSWFTHEPLLLRLRNEVGLHVVGMVKQLSQRYLLNGLACTIPMLFDKVSSNPRVSKDIYGSIIVTTKAGLPVKIVFIVNRNNRSKILAILSTDVEMTDKEIVQVYARRFEIEGNFYNLKHHLRINKECQCRNYDSCYAYTAIGMLRLIVLEYQARCNTDPNTIGGLFYQEREDQFMLPFKQALSKILHFITEIPEMLAEHGLIVKEKIGEARELLIGKFFDSVSDVGRYIHDYIETWVMNDEKSRIAAKSEGLCA